MRLSVIRHVDLTAADCDALAGLFDTEYQDTFGPWTSERPYGYAGHDVHVIAYLNDAVAGHAGWGRRRIRVGQRAVTIAGVGGVLVSPAARGHQLGTQLMTTLADSMLGTPGGGSPDLEFGYLGCREAVAPFYRACGWQRIAARERFVDRRTGEPQLQKAGPPLLVLPLRGNAWPDGDIDLLGPPW